MEFSHHQGTTRRRDYHDVDDEETAPPSSAVIEKEHMFDKVVTPSDVGKLNRLVIPKQHAEKYFPLDTSSSSSSASESATKGLLLNFEDSTGKPWRFRYSYWNSSQSYVMTKGWSRFVKDKRLDAGDTVSFGRNKDRLFIDWKRRPQSQQQQHHQYHHRFGLSTPNGVNVNYPVLSFAPYNGQNLGYNAGQYLVFRSAVAQGEGSSLGLPMVLESVPVVAHREEMSSSSSSVAKRVRLFGVNLDVPESPGSSASLSPKEKEDEEDM